MELLESRPHTNHYFPFRPRMEKPVDGESNQRAVPEESENCGGSGKALHRSRLFGEQSG